MVRELIMLGMKFLSPDFSSKSGSTAQSPTKVNKCGKGAAGLNKEGFSS
jgi:hypothetical protein